MKVLERVLERKLREKVNIDGMQFGFMPGKGTTDAIFVVRQMQEKFVAKNRKLYYMASRNRLQIRHFDWFLSGR